VKAWTVRKLKTPYTYSIRAHEHIEMFIYNKKNIYVWVLEEGQKVKIGLKPGEELLLRPLHTEGYATSIAKRPAAKKNPGRPPKAWWEKTVRRLKKAPDIVSPERLAGWIWHHHMSKEAKRRILRQEAKK